MKPLNSVLLSALLLVLAAGCTHHMPMAVMPTAMPVGDKLPRHAALVLNKDLTDYKYANHMMGDAFEYKLGAPLQDYAKHVTGAVFEQVDEAPSADQAFANASADIVLIPRAVKADKSAGVWAASKQDFTLVVEWMAKDRATHNTIWLQTITADASGTMGSAFSYKSHSRQLMQKLFDDLSLKTFEAMHNAPELKAPAVSTAAK
jgi:hypothetical protein